MSIRTLEDGRIEETHSCGSKTIWHNMEAYEYSANISKIEAKMLRESGLFEEFGKLSRAIDEAEQYRAARNI